MVCRWILNAEMRRTGEIGWFVQQVNAPRVIYLDLKKPDVGVR